MNLPELQDELRELRHQIGELEDEIYKERRKEGENYATLLAVETLLGAAWEILEQAKGFVDGRIIRKNQSED